MGPDGAPRAEVWVYAQTLQWVGEQRLSLPSVGRSPAFVSYAQATTDADGRFALTGLLGDRWEVVVNNERTVQVSAEQVAEGAVRLVHEGPIDHDPTARSQLVEF